MFTGDSFRKGRRVKRLEKSEGREKKKKNRRKGKGSKCP